MTRLIGPIEIKISWHERDTVSSQQSTPNSSLRCNLLVTTTKLPRQRTRGSISTKFRISYFPQISKPNRRENPFSLYNSFDSSAYPAHLTIHQTQTKSRPLKKKNPPPHHKVCAAVSPNSHHLSSLRYCK